jgi:hypothetical protein
MTEPTQRRQDPTHSKHSRAPQPEDIWDRFIDELDRQGQAGSAADVLTPSTLGSSGKRFGDLSREDIDNLSKIGSNMGRRGDVVKTIWEQTQQQLKQQRRGRS